MPTEEPANAWPMRDITDPKALRALAHPLRIRLMEQLLLHGPATATQLAERVDESPANCSWHLRQLARYGYVEEAGPLAGRQRPWRFVPQGNRWDPASTDDMAVAGRAIAGMLLNREVDALHAYWARLRQEPPEWADAAYFAQTVTWLTVEELREIQQSIAEVIMRYMRQYDTSEARPPGARPVRLVAWAVPTEQSPEAE